jgi:hypothetical protein
MQYLKFLLVLSSVILSVMSRRSHRRRNRWGVGGTGALSTCKDFRVDGSRLYADCQDTNQAWIKTGIDMSKCLVNNNGVLGNGGAYNDSCEKMSIRKKTENEKNPSIIKGKCKNTEGTYVDASVAISDAFGNQNGVLVC